MCNILIILHIVRGHSVGKLEETSLPRGTHAVKPGLASPVCRMQYFDENMHELGANCFGIGLDSVPNDLYDNIQILLINYNMIQKLSNTSFIRYSLLYQIDLSHNNIRLIEKEAFKAQQYLTSLELSDNPNLHRINAEIFQWSPKLLELRLDNTGLGNFPEDSMKWLQNLKNLGLTQNNITSIHLKTCPNPIASIWLSENNISMLTPETIAIDCDLIELGLTGNPVVSVEPELFSNLRTKSLTLGGDAMTSDLWSQTFRGIAQSNNSIRSLTIYPTAINYIAENFFQPLHSYPLSTLEIMGKCLVGSSVGSVQGIDPSALKNLNNLFELYIFYCNITKLGADYFEGMNHLTRLCISGSFKTIITSNNSWDNIYLTSLDLGDNLREVKPSTFRGLTGLESLTLQGNNDLAVFDITSASGLKNLQYIDLSFTAIIRLTLYTPRLYDFSLSASHLGMTVLSPGKTFNFSKSLGRLYLSAIYIQTHALYDHIRNISIFEGLRNLTYLDLRQNYLYTLLSDMFVDLSSLEKLYLEDSNIAVIESNAFRGLKSLRELGLDRNFIKVVTFDMFRYLIQLKSLDLQENEIYSLDMNLFENSPFLKSLNLGYNHLAGFNRSSFEPGLYNLETIYVDGNPIICNCKLKWMVDWLSGPTKLLSAKYTICLPVPATLGPLRGKPLMRLASTNLCHPEITTYLLVALSFLTVFVIMLVSYWHRWFLRHKLFLLKLAIIGYKEVEDNLTSDQFKYALNIVFTDDCKEWIQEHLRPFREGAFPDKGRVILGDDDLKLGMHYLDAVLYAMENSFKTVLLITRAAIDDHLFLTKLRLAMDYATDIGTENLILIFIEDILDDELPYPVKLFLSGSGSYLSWTDDDAGQEYFWEQLQKYLNVNRKINHLIPGQ